MSSSGFKTFDAMVQEANLWLKAVMSHLQTDDRQQAYVALRAVLHTLRDRIGPEAAVHLGAQLPTLLRGIYYEGWHMAGTPTKERHEVQFLEHVRRELGSRTDLDARRAAEVVFEVMWEKVDPGEIAKVANMLPMELRDLWPVVALRP